MAGVLIKILFGRLRDQQRAKTLQVLRSWVELRDEQAQLAAASLNVYSIIVDSAADDVESIINVVVPAVTESSTALLEAETTEDDVMLDHQVPLNALKALVRALEVSPASATSMPWESIIQHLLFPHTGVRLAAARCISILMTQKDGIDGVTLLGEEALLEIARKSCLLMKGEAAEGGRLEVVDPKLADVLVKILWNISKHWAVSPFVPLTISAFADAKVSHKAPNTAALEIEAQAEVDEEDEEDAEEPAFVKARKSTQPLSWLMSRMSYLARHLIVHRPSANSNMFIAVSLYDHID
jgi:U3 small nucleolar RNA-associated protein 20